ncbi:MAG: hypothetical protein MHM6MM_003420 [Cercozoa sp. M6MM]
MQILSRIFAHQVPFKLLHEARSIALESDEHLDTARRIGRIVAFAVGMTRCTEKAFDWFCENQLRTGDVVILVHAMPNVISQLAAASPETQQKVVQAEQYSLQHAQSKLQHYADRIEKHAIANCYAVQRILAGEARAVIVAECEHWKVDLLVMGSHGQGLLGSTSDFCAHYAPCPLLISRSAESVHSSTSSGLAERSGSELY